MTELKPETYWYQRCKYAELWRQAETLYRQNRSTENEDILQKSANNYYIFINNHKPK